MEHEKDDISRRCQGGILVVFSDLDNSWLRFRDLDYSWLRI